MYVSVAACSVPVVTVSNVQSLVIASREVQLTWDQVSCSERRGLQSRYDILVVQSTSLALTLNTSTNSSPPFWVYALQPYTQYSVRVRYANEYGTAAYSDSVAMTTQPDGTWCACQSETIEY